MHTGRSAPALLINAQQEISALKAQMARFEADNAQLVSDTQYQVDPQKRHETRRS